MQQEWTELKNEHAMRVMSCGKGKRRECVVMKRRREMTVGKKSRRERLLAGFGKARVIGEHAGTFWSSTRGSVWSTYFGRMKHGRD